MRAGTGGPMKTLLVTFTEIDFSSGGAMRSALIHGAMQQCGLVRTLIVQKGDALGIDAGWASDGIRRVRFAHEGYGFAALLERIQIRRWIREIVREEAIDVIVARYLSMAMLVPREFRSRLVIDADDAIKSSATGMPSSLKRRVLHRVRNALISTLVARSAHVWFPNPGDSAKLAFAHKTLLRNAVKTPAGTSGSTPAVPGRILMVGAFWYAPNANGLEWFVKEILPKLVDSMPEVELHVVGQSGAHMQFGSDRVRLRGFVPDLAAEYAEAALVIAPIHFGGGTQIKVVEALAYGRPVVASEFAYKGFAEDLVRERHLLVARDVPGWLAHCSWVLSERVAAEAMAARGREAVDLYRPQALTTIVTATLHKVAGEV